MDRRTFIQTSLACAIGATMPSVSGAQGTKTIFRWVPHADLTLLDPLFTTAFITNIHAQLVFDTLYAVDADFNIQPQMAQGHTVDKDHLLWTINLREGLTFHDVNTFKIFIKGRLEAELGNSRLDTFQARCDLANLHLPGSLQTQVLYNGRDDLETFFAFIVANTKQVLTGQVIIARRAGVAVAPRAGAGAGAASTPDIWTCPVCSFNNKCPRPTCGMCGEPRPSGFCSSSGGRRKKTIRKHKKSKKTRRQRKRTV
jgi:hypothetical protein